MSNFKHELWLAFRNLQRNYELDAIDNPDALSWDETPTDYANKMINELSNVELIDQLTN